jgi:carbon monoxide dehydrogenase subunit G
LNSGKSELSSKTIALSGAIAIPAPPQAVWTALNDPAVLARCLPGCDSFGHVESQMYSAVATVKLGPLRTRIGVNITVTQSEPPHRATLVIHAKGKIGSAETVVRLHFDETNNGTELNYTAQAHIGGQLGTMAERWGRDAAKELVGEFLQRFAAAVPREDAVAQTISPADYVMPLSFPPPPRMTLRKKALWIGIGTAAGAALATAAALLLTRRGSR